jgi:hypothetical protein
MNTNPKTADWRDGTRGMLIGAFNGSTVSTREPHDVDGNVTMQPWPTTLDGIFAELADKRAQSAVERCSERVMENRYKRAR